jgi:hypothetical protein
MLESGERSSSGKIIVHEVNSKEESTQILKAHQPSLESRLRNSAFIQFNSQAAAHMACQRESHHTPSRIAPRLVEIAPGYVIWDNMSMKSNCGGDRLCVISIARPRGCLGEQSELRLFMWVTRVGGWNTGWTSIPISLVRWKCRWCRLERLEDVEKLDSTYQG